MKKGEIMNKAAIIDLLEKSLEADPGSISGTEKVDALPDWDSLAAVVFMGEVDEHFGITLDPDELENVESVEDIVKMILAKE